jgi:hypothetical protein
VDLFPTTTAMDGERTLTYEGNAEARGLQRNDDQCSLFGGANLMADFRP